jgi:hypothetical protein
MSNGKGSAFVKGGCGCLLAFLAIGLTFVLLGGSVHINAGGAILLFVIGGVIGLVILAVYRSGQRDAMDREFAVRRQRDRDAMDREFAFRKRRDPYEHPEGGEVGGTGVKCPHCGANVNPATGEGLHCPVGKPWVLICDKCQNTVEPSS